MTKLTQTVLGFLICTGLLVVGPSSGLAVEPGAATTRPLAKSTIVLALRPNVSLESREICLGDVAAITCNDVGLRERLKQLDLEDALPIGGSVTIDAARIRFRLQVAGISGDRISIRGTTTKITVRDSSATREPESVKAAVATMIPIPAPAAPSPLPSTTKLRRPIDLAAADAEEGSLEREVIRSAQACVLARLPWPADAVDFRLAQPVPNEIRDAGSAEGYELSTELRSTGSAVGRVHVRVIAEGLQRQTFDVPIVMEVRHFEKIVVTARGLERGHVLNASDLYVDRQDVTDLSEYCTKTEELVGQSLKRSIRALQPLKMNDVETHARADTTVLVKRRDEVKVMARLGGVSVEAKGEALQDGRMGEVIRVRNIQSNVTIQGRVTRLGEVEIAF